MQIFNVGHLCGWVASCFNLNVYDELAGVEVQARTPCALWTGWGAWDGELLPHFALPHFALPHFAYSKCMNTAGLYSMSSLGEGLDVSHAGRIPSAQSALCWTWGQPLSQDWAVLCPLQDAQYVACMCMACTMHLSRDRGWLYYGPAFLVMPTSPGQIIIFK